MLPEPVSLCEAVEDLVKRFRERRDAVADNTRRLTKVKATHEMALDILCMIDARLLTMFFKGGWSSTKPTYRRMSKKSNSSNKKYMVPPRSAASGARRKSRSF